MKTAEAQFQFPVLGFTPDTEIWGFPDLDRLTRCGPRTLQGNMQSGMELIGSDGRRWGVRSVKRIGRAGSLIKQLLFFGLPQSRIEHELEPLERVSLEEVQRRACAAIEAHADNYCHHSAEEDWETFVEPLLAEVNATRNISDIYDLLQPDTFEPC
jgi:hypothetical protein